VEGRVYICKVDSDRAITVIKQGEFAMLEAVVGADIAKKKFDVALFMNGKFKHKTCVNTRQGFEELSQWLTRQGICAGRAASDQE
jgi:hypothetical protein